MREKDLQIDNAQEVNNPILRHILKSIFSIPNGVENDSLVGQDCEGINWREYRDYSDWTDWSDMFR